HDPPHRARHEARDGGLGASHGARVRGEDRRGQSPRRPVRPPCRRGVSGKGGSVMSETATNGRVLEVDAIETYYGTIRALKGISLEVQEGEVVTWLGAKGAGKTTTLRSINGLNHPRRGRVVFEGRDITSLTAHRIVKLGISQSPEGRKLFPR